MGLVSGIDLTRLEDCIPMRIRYTVPFKRKIIIDDHWEIPMQGGTIRVIEENGYATGLEIIFENQPLEYAPALRKDSSEQDVTTIIGRDHLIPFVTRQLDDAAKFIECMHDIELITEEISANYEAEMPEEDAQLAIKSMSVGRHDPALPLSFDMLTRAIMAAEKRSGPNLEATLARSARQALFKQEFINSFRYSFLLIEFLYGRGQFKKAGLQAALKEDKEFRAIIDSAINEGVRPRGEIDSDTARLLSKNPTVDGIIDHLVEKRGFYFHGNVKRKDAWKPDEQGAAEALALLALGIVTEISMRAAAPLFDPAFEKRHFEDAMRVGAKLVFEIKFQFREPEEEFDREGRLNINIPGTKVTPRSAFSVAQHFLQKFEYNQPASALRKVECNLRGTGQRVFEFTFYVLDDREKTKNS